MWEESERNISAFFQVSYSPRTARAILEEENSSQCESTLRTVSKMQLLHIHKKLKESSVTNFISRPPSSSVLHKIDYSLHILFWYSILIETVIFYCRIFFENFPHCFFCQKWLGIFGFRFYFIKNFVIHLISYFLFCVFFKLPSNSINNN